MQQGHPACNKLEEHKHMREFASQKLPNEDIKGATNSNLTKQQPKIAKQIDIH